MNRKVVHIIYALNEAKSFIAVADALRAHDIDSEYIFIRHQKPKLAFQLESRDFKTYFINYRGTISKIFALIKIINILIQTRPKAVHSHFLPAGLYGLFASKLLGIKYRIYTRHYSDYHHLYFKKSVVMDKIINKLCTKVIAISSHVRDILIKQENCPPEKIALVHHGFEAQDFIPQPDRIKALQNKYNIPEDCFIVGIISRYEKWKGIHNTIDAFINFQKKHPKSFLLLANAWGVYEPEIKKKLSKLSSDSFVEIQYEADISSLYGVMDVLVHVPITSIAEAFGQVYLETMLARKPLICTLSGIANEFIIDKKHALVVNYDSITDIETSLSLIIENRILKDDLIQNAFKLADEEFKFSDMIQQLISLYGLRK